MKSKTRVFSKGELKQLHLVLKREKMLPVTRVWIANVPLNPFGGSHAKYMSEIIFSNIDKSLKLTSIGAIPIDEIKATRQIYEYFGIKFHLDT